VVVGNGAKVVGHWSVEGYEFDESKALTADRQCFVGLAIDEDQQEDLTSARLNDWCQQVVREMGLDIEVELLDD
jgi:flavodoxin I